MALKKDNTRSAQAADREKIDYYVSIWQLEEFG